MKQQTVLPGEGTDYDWTNDHIYVKTVGAFSEGRVSLIEDTLKPGFHLARHYHKKMTEVFYILEGELTLVFDDETVVAKVGTTITVPPNVWHEAISEKGAKMLSLFSLAGFEDYLAELKTLTDGQFADETFLQTFNEKYDIWSR